MTVLKREHRVIPKRSNGFLFCGFILKRVIIVNKEFISSFYVLNLYYNVNSM